MTLLEFEELLGYWAGHPPVHVMVAAYLGVKPQTSPAFPPGAALAPAAQPAEKRSAAGDVSRMMAQLTAAGFVTGYVYEGCEGAAVFDFAELKARAAANRERSAHARP